MMTLPAGIVISFVFAVLVAIIFTFAYISHLKNNSNNFIQFKNIYNNLLIDSFYSDNKKINNTIEELRKSNNHLKIKNKLLSANYSKNKRKNYSKKK